MPTFAGFLKRLTDPHDAAARALLQQAVVHVVPNVRACRRVSSTDFELGCV